MLLCEYCIEELRSRGEPVFVGERVYSYEEAEEDEGRCELCDEYGDLYECVLK